MGDVNNSLLDFLEFSLLVFLNNFLNSKQSLYFVCK